MSEIKGFINISNNKSLKKKILCEGNGEKPVKGKKVTVKYKKCKGKNYLEIFLLKKAITIVYTIGTNIIDKELEIGIQTMKEGEKSLFIFNFSRKYSFNESFTLKRPNQIIYEIELVNCEKNKRNYSFLEKIYKLENNEIDDKRLERLKIKYINNIEKNQFGNFMNDIKNNYLKNKNENKNKNNKDSKSLSKIKKVDYIKKYEQFERKYKELELKTDSLICDKCFRLLYISFDFIKNFIATKCPYCLKFNAYKYDDFIEKLKKYNNPLSNSNCQKCLKKITYSERAFYLIEKPNYTFFVVCNECLSHNEYKDYIKKYTIQELVDHYLYIYDGGGGLDKIKQTENEFKEMKKKY